VSSAKQKDDLERQIASLRESHPEHEVVKDIGSGINFKRKGLRSLLERSLEGGLDEVVVAHRDRLCRFAFDLIEWLFTKHGTKLVVLDQDVASPESESEFTEDLLSIVHVFSCRYNGLRRYRKRLHQEIEKGATNARKTYAKRKRTSEGTDAEPGVEFGVESEAEAEEGSLSEEDPGDRSDENEED